MKPTAGTIWDAGLRGVRARNRFEPIPLWADIEMKPTDGSIWDAGLRAWNERCEAQGLKGLKLEACDTDIARGGLRSSKRWWAAGRPAGALPGCHSQSWIRLSTFGGRVIAATTSMQSIMTHLGRVEAPDCPARRHPRCRRRAPCHSRVLHPRNRCQARHRRYPGRPALAAVALAAAPSLSPSLPWHEKFASVFATHWGKIDPCLGPVSHTGGSGDR